MNFISGVMWFMILLLNTSSADFTFTIYHTGDTHAHFDQDKKGIGGIGRIITYIKNEKARGEPMIYLDAGDIFTGTIWFSVYRTEIAADFVQMLGVDAMCIGNHEFDEGISKLKRYFELTRLPLVCANADFSKEQNLDNYVKPSLILDVNNVSIGIVGYINNKVGDLSPIGQIKVEDEASALRREIKKLKEKGVNIIIGLGHSGYGTDQTLASSVEDIDIIVGGHTHTFLYTGKSPVSKPDPKGDYPTIKMNPKGYIVPIVHAYAYSKFVGKLQVSFDDNGVLKKFTGMPVYMDESIEIDPDAENMLEKYRPGILKLQSIVLGKNYVDLSGECRFYECNLGNLITDAFVNFKSREYDGPYWTDTAIALINGGAIRSSISHDLLGGNITVADVYGAIPFDNILVTLEINGSTLLKAIEYGVSSNGTTSRGEFLQFSGVHVVYNLRYDPFERVEDIKIRCANCDIPKYEPLSLNGIYKIVVTNYMATGGDGYNMLLNEALSTKSVPIVDSEVLMNYIKFYHTVQPHQEERIMVKDGNRIYITGDTNCIIYDKVLYIFTSIIYIYIYILSLYK